jgi:hypothetical protein
MIEESGFDSRQRQENLFLSTMFRSALGAQPAIHPMGESGQRVKLLTHLLLVSERNDVTVML